MEKKRKKLHRSNEGFTLIELIVTMLISSIVTAAVAGFLSMGLNYYQRTNAETSLQTESQVAELFLTELLQEAADYKVLDSGDYPAGVDYAVEVKRADSGKVSIVVRKGTALLYGEVDVSGNPSVTELIQAVSSKGMEEVFLAQYISGFSVSPAIWADAIDLNHGLVNLGLEFNINGKTYTGDETVLLRNTKKN